MPFNYSISNMAGQRIMAGFEGVSLNNELRFLIEKIRVNGIILFRRNIESPEQIKNLTNEAQIFAREKGLPKLFIAIDQEGGTVSRLREPFTQFKDGANGIKSISDARHFAKITSDELKSIGVNMNMAPVLDIDPFGFKGIMEKRALGHTPEEVSERGAEIVKTFEGNSILSVIKHFPGIGKTVLDSHFELPVLNDSFDELYKSDLIPFIECIKKGASAVMVSHILYSMIDEEWPASLSPSMIKKILRRKLGFDGVVITDDLDMKAVKCDIRTAVSQCMKSDIDIPLICKSGSRIEEAFNQLSKGLKDNTLLKESGEKSIHRILSLKKKLIAV